jgi:hypothetical protein
MMTVNIGPLFLSLSLVLSDFLILSSELPERIAYRNELRAVGFNEVSPSAEQLYEAHFILSVR